MTKQQVIDILEAYKPSSNIYNGYNSIEEKIDERICYLIDEIIESIKREPDNDWIKCSEKMPKNDKSVLVVIKEDGYTDICVGETYGEGNWMISGDSGEDSIKDAVEEYRNRGGGNENKMQ